MIGFYSVLLIFSASRSKLFMIVVGMVSSISHSTLSA